jgi:hypothetical protein
MVVKQEVASRSAAEPFPTVRLCWVPSYVSDLIHIQMAVHRFDPSDMLGSCERVLHSTINRVL